MLQETTLPFNLRTTTSECMHLVMCGHFGYVTKDGGQLVSANSMLYANFMALCSQLLPIEVVHCGNRDIGHFVSLTLTLTRWPSYTNFCTYFLYSRGEICRQETRNVHVSRGVKCISIFWTIYARLKSVTVVCKRYLYVWRACVFCV